MYKGIIKTKDRMELATRSPTSVSELLAGLTQFIMMIETTADRISWPDKMP